VQLLVRPSAPIVLTNADACACAAKLTTDVAANAESRFNNLTAAPSRVLSALALVTTLLGVFSTSFLGSKLNANSASRSLRKAWYPERSYYAFFAALVDGAVTMPIILSI
jgi:hypothetical protein